MTVDTAWTSLGWTSLKVVKRLKEARADREELLAQSHARAELEKKEREPVGSIAKFPAAFARKGGRQGS